MPRNGHLQGSSYEAGEPECLGALLVLVLKHAVKADQKRHHPFSLPGIITFFKVNPAAGREVQCHPVGPPVGMTWLTGGKQERTTSGFITGA